MRQPRTPQQKKLDAAMKAHSALFLLDSVAALLEQLPRVDEKLASNCAKWSRQLIKERNRMLPLAEAADKLLV